MKLNKFLMLAASALLFCGACDDGDKELAPLPVEDAILVNPQKTTVGSKGGEVPVMVTSTGAWTLAGEENGYVIPSAFEGVDGDVVTFVVKANDQEVDQLFSYTFTCGTKSTELQITLKKMASQTEEQLEIFYPENSNTFTREGGQVTVLVISSGTWTLEGESDFVTPSATSGEDGAEVTFTVAPNETDQERMADYTFKMGDKTASLHITEAGADPERIEITSKSELRLAYTADDRLAVTLKTNVDSRDLTAEITGADDGWLAWSIARPAENGAEEEVTAYFTMTQNDGLAARQATVTIKGVKDARATLTVTQLPQSQLQAEKASYSFKLEAQELVIPVTTNVEFDVEIAESGREWVTYNGYSEGALHLSVAELTDGAARETTVTLTEKNGPENADPQRFVITITQRPNGLIEWVADMRKSRCYLVNNMAELNSVTSGTLEALVNLQEARSAGSISTIMGVEGRFLLRLGDTGLPWNQLQLAMAGGNVTDESLILPELNRWYHIAVTWNSTGVDFYIDGKLTYHQDVNIPTVAFGLAYRDYESSTYRAFWLGYSYNAERYFPGYMSEVRVWKRQLTEEEINAENHFYSVPGDSEALVGYWKLNEGSGANVKDSSTSGADMLGQHDVRTYSNYISTGTSDLNYVKVDLP